MCIIHELVISEIYWKWVCPAPLKMLKLIKMTCIFEKVRRSWNETYLIECYKWIIGASLFLERYIKDAQSSIQYLMYNLRVKYVTKRMQEMNYIKANLFSNSELDLEIYLRVTILLWKSSIMDKTAQSILILTSVYYLVSDG